MQGVAQQVGEVEEARLGRGIGRGVADAQQIGAADQVLEPSHAQLRHVLAHVLGQQEQVVDQMFRLTLNLV